MKRYLLLAILAVAVLTVFNVALAEEEMEYSWGVVSDITSDKLVLSEYDYDTDSESEVSYSIASDVEVVNVDSVKEISIGDSVEIESVTKGKDKIAKLITVEILEEEYMPSETYNEEPEYVPEDVEY